MSQKQFDDVQIEKLVFGGQALGRLPDGQVAFVWNALPGEVVSIDVIKKKKNHIQAIASNIENTSPYRQDPIEDHYLSSSPWQILTPERELYWKTEIAKEAYYHLDLPTELSIAQSDNQFGYRNKIEYSFAEDENGEIQFAFFKRGGGQRLPIPCSKLATDEINETAKDILEWVRKHKITLRSLKALILRSNRAGETIAALFIKDVMNFDDYPELHDGFEGFQLYYSTHKSPASVPTELLYSTGQDYLVETLLGKEFKFGLLSFFQVNPPVFEDTLNDIMPYLDTDTDILDFYAGVGAIGIALADYVKSSILVESNEEAVTYANENIIRNGLEDRCQAILTPAEDVYDMIQADKTIIFDPPRAGLHKRIVEKVNQVCPQKIIYVSCNLTTQARDIESMLDCYNIVFSKLYNYFPRTPHVEGLIVLERK